jgi:hypothetical protein
VCSVSYSELSESRKYFISTAFQICFSVPHLGGPGGIELSGTYQPLVYADCLEVVVNT